MTKIDIISGFLGAGKTTLIKKLIEEVYTGEKLVLIENEFGEIGIDGGFMKDAGIEVSEINSGCICCSLVGDFEEALMKVMEQFAPDHIIIEPSGVGKLSDIIVAVKSVADRNKLMEIDKIMTVADATKCKMYIRNYGEFYNNQLENSSTIVLSRTQIMNEDKLTDVLSLLQDKNSRAAIITTPWEQLTGEQILDALTSRESLRQQLIDEVKHDNHEHHHHHEHDHDHHHDHEHEHHHEHDHDHEHDHEHDNDHEHEHHHDHEHDHDHEHEHDHNHEHHHDHDHHHADEIFSSWGAETSISFTKEFIENVLKELDSGSYGDILRAKGIVPSEDGKWFHFDYVPNEHNVRNGSANYTGTLCVIGAELNTEKLNELFGVKGKT